MKVVTLLASWLSLVIGSTMVHAEAANLQPSETLSGTQAASSPPALLTPSPSDRADTAYRYALWGTLVPAGAGCLFSIITQPGGKNDVPVWQLGTLGALFGTAVAWGPSMGYYQGDLPLYATLSGVAKSGALAGAVYLDRRSNAGMPALTVLALTGVVVWDVVDLMTIGGRVSTLHEKRAGVAVAPVAGLSPQARGVILGATGTF